jgi:hypothetical protein
VEIMQKLSIDELLDMVITLLGLYPGTVMSWSYRLESAIRDGILYNDEAQQITRFLNR